MITFQSIYHSIENYKINTNQAFNKDLFIDTDFEFAIWMLHPTRDWKSVRMLPLKDKTATSYTDPNSTIHRSSNTARNIACIHIITLFLSLRNKNVCLTSKGENKWKMKYEPKSTYEMIDKETSMLRHVCEEHKIQHSYLGQNKRNTM